jgi:hypothetical protein
MFAILPWTGVPINHRLTRSPPVPPTHFQPFSVFSVLKSFWRKLKHREHGERPQREEVKISCVYLGQVEEEKIRRGCVWPRYGRELELTFAGDTRLVTRAERFAVQF